MMKKNLKFIVSTLVIITFLFTCTNIVWAATPDMNLSSNTVNNTEENTLDTTNEVTTATLSNTSSSTIEATESTQIKNLNPVTESGLGLTNILNILLIAVGVVLILLGIAIIIKIKN